MAQSSGHHLGTALYATLCPPSEWIVLHTLIDTTPAGMGIEAIAEAEA
ncbi:MAG: hypothetical protein PHX69_02480 [Simplicispira sp.]|nr:hypothetical protein [Simplicispira sp.]MDD2690633.1 hypothetical protein [Simplicispira sp.]